MEPQSDRLRTDRTGEHPGTVVFCRPPSGGLRTQEIGLAECCGRGMIPSLSTSVRQVISILDRVCLTGFERANRRRQADGELEGGP